MKELVRTIKQTFQVHGSDSVFGLLASIGGAVFGILLVLIIMAVDGTGEDYGMIGTMMALLSGMITIVLGGVFSTQSEFNLAISMGKTRRCFVPARYLKLVVDTVIVEGVVILTSVVEKALYPAFYPGTVCELGFEFFTGNPVVLIGVALGAPVLVLLMGALMMKFSAKFLWVFWVLWMLCCMVVPRIMRVMEESPDSRLAKLGNGVLEFLEKKPTASGVVVFVTVIAVLMALTYGLFRKQRVTA